MANELDVSNELMHYGILGQKWGVRRTDAQLGNRSAKGRSEDAVKSERKKTSQARRYLSDAELKKAVERLQTEKKLKDLTDEDVSPGKNAAKKILSQVGKTTVTAVATAVATYSVKAAMEGKFDIKEAAKFIRPKK